MTFVVFVDNNAHYRDESERHKQGEYDNYEEALIVAKNIIDEFLSKNRDQYSEASILFRIYSLYGEDPYIVPDPAKVSGGTRESFSAMNYARQRCQQLYDEQTADKGSE